MGEKLEIQLRKCLLVNWKELDLRQADRESLPEILYAYLLSYKKSNTSALSQCFCKKH